MDKHAQASSRGLWAAGVVVVLPGALLTDCSTTTKPPGDSFSAGDAGGTQLDAGSHDDATVSPPDATTPHPDATTPAPDATSPLDAGRPQDSSSDDGSCQAGQTFCGGGCVDTKTDPNNCGQCSNACGALACIAGQCACATDAGQANCNNTCVSIPTDPNNCGACGHSCQGSTCSNFLCQPTVVATPNVQGIWDLVVDQQILYWTQSGAASGIAKKPFAGGAITPVPGSVYLADPRGIAVESHNPLNLYWVDYANGVVEKWPLLGGTTTAIVAPPALDASAPDGGPPEQPPATPIDIAVDTNSVYWVSFDDGKVLSVSTNGGVWATLASGEDHPIAITVDDTNIYWVDQGSPGGTGSVHQASKSGAMPMTLATGEAKPSDIAVDGTSVYWTDNANPGMVRKVPIGGGGTVVTLASNQGAPYGIAVDRTPPGDGGAIGTQYVYWTNFNDNTVMRLPSGGGQQPFVLASGQNNPAAIVVDDKNVYWVNQGAGTILKVAK